MLCAVLSRVHRGAGSTFLLFAGALFAAGCSDPQRPAVATNSGFDARWNGGHLEFALDGQTGTTTNWALVATNLQFDAATEVLRAHVALQNRDAQPAPGPASIVVYGFVPAAVQALDASCGAPLAAGECAVDYRGAYGEDGVLAPGESSAPVVWRLHVPGGQSFAFRARLGDPERGPGTIAGVVFADTDGDGVRDDGEAGVEDVRVHIRTAAASDNQRTDTQGRYAFPVSAPGIYEITLDLGDGWRTTTAMPLQVTILRQPDGSLSSFTLGDIGVDGGATGPTIQVEGFAYVDLDRDGQRDAGEPGIAAVKIRGRACDRAANKVVDDDDDFEARTDASGHYVLTLPDCGGPWEIRAGSVDDSDRTTPKDVVLADRPAPGAALRADFGYAPEDVSAGFRVRGVVFRDDDGDGIRDANEPALLGVLVTADGIDCAGPAFASDHSDERGRYELEGRDVACPMPWLVQRAAIAGTDETTPASVRLNAPPLFSREFVVDFGVRFRP